jgi:hypothetical protein
MGEVIEFRRRETPTKPLEASGAQQLVEYVESRAPYVGVSKELLDKQLALSVGAISTMAQYLKAHGIELTKEFWIDVQNIYPILNGVIDRRLGIDSPMAKQLHDMCVLKQQGTDE